MNNYIFSLEIKVRDYEIDAEGIVNNANYLHYLEHTRHEFCEFAGFSFKEMQEKGIAPVLNRIDVIYKTPLRSNDTMISKLWVEMKGARFVFHQDIFKKDNNEQVIKAIISCVCLENGKLTRGEILAEKFKAYLQ
ncbi:MAG: thioesterase family protein [Muribaculaceae bacterium]